MRTRTLTFPRYIFHKQETSFCDNRLLYVRWINKIVKKKWMQLSKQQKMHLMLTRIIQCYQLVPLSKHMTRMP